MRTFTYLHKKSNLFAFSLTLKHYDIDEDDEGLPRLTFNIPRELADGFINNKRENYKFRYVTFRYQYLCYCPTVITITLHAPTPHKQRPV